ncbi:MAG: alkaline phosphatase family protein [Deltaproteobacteria bacterium]|nr:alkaline phosphatase family protein [Deltaproteobacteria bacterium]
MLPTPEQPAEGMEALRWPEAPHWFRPHYGRSLTGVMGTLFHLLGRPTGEFPTLMAHLPKGSPRKAKRVLLLCVDSLGFKELGHSRQLKALFPDCGTWITSVFPTITSCALSSLYQGLPPARHGTLGHVIWREFPGAVVDMLKGKVVRARATLQEAGCDLSLLRGAPGILDGPVGKNLPGYQLMDQAIVGSGLSEIIYGEAPRVAFADPLEGIIKAGRILENMETGWVSLYMARVDTLTHVLTGDAPQLGLVVQHLEAMLGMLAASLPAKVLEETALLVAADHGQNIIRQRVPLQGEDLAWLESHTRALGFSGRVLHVYVNEANERAVKDRLVALTGEAGRVFRFDEVVGLTGPAELFRHPADVTPPVNLAAVRRTLGDLVVVLDDGWNWERRGTLAPAEPYESRLVSQHGALTWHEVFVPFFCAPLGALRPE